jgi:hypothetical protein
MPVAFGVALLRAEVRTGAVGNLDFAPCVLGFSTLEASGRSNFSAGETLGTKERASWSGGRASVGAGLETGAASGGTARRIRPRIC